MRMLSRGTAVLVLDATLLLLWQSFSSNLFSPGHFTYREGGQLPTFATATGSQLRFIENGHLAKMRPMGGGCKRDIAEHLPIRRKLLVEPNVTNASEVGVQHGARRSKRGESVF